MYCSNCGAEVEGKFCSNCGAKIQVNVQPTSPFSNQDEASVKPQANATKAPPSVLIRSKSCMPILEQKRKRFFRVQLGSLVLRVVLDGIVLVLFPQILTLFQLSPSEVQTLFLIALSASFVGLIIDLIFFALRKQKIDDFYMQYKFYSSAEILTVEDDKISGSSTEGPLKLLYSQIRTVFLSPIDFSSRASKLLDFSNDILKIRDTTGNEFVFYAFANCKKLKTVIEWRLTEQQDD